MTPGSRILFVKLAALGDVAMASAFAEAVKARDPEARVTWLCGRRVADLVRLFPSVDEVLTVDEAALLTGSPARRAGALWAGWRALLGRRFDRIVVGHADRRYDVVAWTARGPRRALRRGADGRAMPVRGRWFADEHARLADDGPDTGPRVRSATMSDLRGRVPRAVDALPALGGRAYAVLVPGGARNALRETPQRRWPIDRYVAIAHRVAEAGLAPVLLGDGHDRALLPAFDGVPHVVDALGVLPLPAALGVLESATVVVSHDTGPLHLARLVRAPTVALFGPTAPADFLREDDSTIVLWGGGRLACRPCYDGREVAPCANNLCMQDVTVDDVTAAIDRLRASRAP